MNENKSSAITNNDFICYPIFCAINRTPAIMKPEFYLNNNFVDEELLLSGIPVYAFITTLGRVKYVQDEQEKFYVSHYYECISNSQGSYYDERFFLTKFVKEMIFYLSTPSRIFERVAYDVCLFDSKKGMPPEQFDKVIYEWIASIKKD